MLHQWHIFLPYISFLCVMEKLNEYLQSLIATSSYELHLEPNKNPYLVSASGRADVSTTPLQGTQISMMVFPLIPPDIKNELPNKQEVEFIHPHRLGRFGFTVQKSPAGFVVTVKPLPPEPNADGTTPEAVNKTSEVKDNPQLRTTKPMTFSIGDQSAAKIDALSDAKIEIVDEEAVAASAFLAETLEEPAKEYVPAADVQPAEVKPNSNLSMQERLDALFHKMAEVGASDLHLSVSMPPMVRKDGRMQELESDEGIFTPDKMRDMLHSIMPQKNRDEFNTRNDTDFAYEITGLARFRCNIFMDRKGMGGVFRIIPTKMTTAEQLGLSKAVLNLCNLSKGLVVVTGPTGSGKSTTLCAMVNHINENREDHIITIEDPIEFVHDNIKCLVNQREVHNHTDSFKDALRAALREDPDILLVGEMRDLETISIAIETAETGHLVFGTLHTTTAASTVDRIIDQFPADRQQQIRVMLSESLKGVISQTLLPKIGGGRIAALEILIVTPAISNLIREGKTFQIPSAMQTGKTHGMVMLNDALFDLVQKKIVEPRDAYLKAVDKANFETMLTRGGFKL